MNKPYELAQKEIHKSNKNAVCSNVQCSQCGIRCDLVAHAAQKKLLEYLEENSLLNHTIRIPEGCQVCLIMEDFGIGEK